MERLKGKWVYLTDSYYNVYEYRLDEKDTYGWSWKYAINDCHINELHIGVGNLPITAFYGNISTDEYFQNWPEVTDNECLMFELRFNLDSTPLKELKSFMEKHDAKV